MAATLYRTLTGQSQKSQKSQKSQQSKLDALAPTSTQQQGPDLVRVTTANTQTGVLNHLTEVQEHRLVEFKQKLETDGWWSADGINGKPTHDDGTLLRYLRARKFDVQGAIGQFTDTEKWMKAQRIEELYEAFDVDLYERARAMYPQWTGHRDKRGIPIYVFEIKGLDSKNVEKYQKESAAYKATLPFHKDLSTPAKLLPLFALYQNLLNFVLPLCSSLERPRPEVPVTNSTNIVDISGVSLRQFWNLKSHMQDASVLATAHYPETLDRIFIIGAPAFFPTVWGWIKRWFDPVTVSKIFILSKNEVKPTLEKFMDPSCFPKKYGGSLDWTWGDVPQPDDETRAALERDGNKGWVKGPALWLNNQRVIVGTQNGKPRTPEKDILEQKPIVYAADYTDEPVHPEKRANASVKCVSGIDTPQTDTTPQPSTHSPLTLVEETTAGAATATSTTHPPEVQPPTKQPNTPHDIPPESIRTSPMGDSQVHVPEAQPAPPATTVEYILPTDSADAVRSQASEDARVPVSTTATAAVAATAVSHPASTTSASPPPGHAQPGSLSTYATDINRQVATNLEQESTVSIPPSANGTPVHAEIVSASDTAKGLAMEADKLMLNEKAERPQAERFVTALEVPH